MLTLRDNIHSTKETWKLQPITNKFEYINMKRTKNQFIKKEKRNYQKFHIKPYKICKSYTCNGKCKELYKTLNYKKFLNNKN